MSVELLSEVFLISVHVGNIVAMMTADCRGKAALIRDLIPRVCFKVGGCGSLEETESALMLLVDRWTYFQPIVKLS